MERVGKERRQGRAVSRAGERGGKESEEKITQRGKERIAEGGEQGERKSRKGEG